MHVLGVTPWDLNERMTVRDFLISCAWLDEFNKPPKGGRSGGT